MRCLPFLMSAAVVIAAAGCSRGNDTDGADIFSDTIYAPERAQGFCILGAPGRNSVVIESLNPWQGADSTRTRLLIARDGEEVPRGFGGKVLVCDRVPRVIAMSSTHVAMMDALGRTDALAGVSGKAFISTRLPGGVADVGYDGSINYEALVGAAPDLVLLYGIGAPSAMEGKLDELGIPYMYVGDYLEESPTGKAEWLVALGEVAGMREDAERQFRSIAGRYDSLRSMVDSVGARPTVMLNTPYADAWFMPSASNYMVRLISDAGGAYVMPELKGNSSTPIDMEQAYVLTHDADFWLNPGQATDMAGLLDQCPRFADTKPVREGQVYNNNLRLTPGGGNDFYESAIVHPDLVLADLISILHPEVLQAPLSYYRQLK